MVVRPLMTTLQQLAEKSDASELTEADVRAYASEQGLTAGQVYDALALHLATGYAQNTLTYEFCDSAINFVMGLTTYNVPDFAWSVYSAFDEGEFYHDKDSRDIDPAEKYTRPCIERILKDAGIASSAA